MEDHSALITNDAVVLGLLAIILGAVFYTSHSPHPAFRKFYKYVPALLMCYFLPSLLNTAGIIDGEQSRLYFVASRYLLPATLVLLTLSIDLQGILRLGPKALIMFGTGTVGIVLGGPLAILLFSAISPETVGGQGPDAVWRGLTTVAGSWIGGGANQAAMKEVFEVGDDLFSAMVAVDVLIANIWLAVLLYMAGESELIDARLGADTTALEALRDSVAEWQAKHRKDSDAHGPHGDMRGWFRRDGHLASTRGLSRTVDRAQRADPRSLQPYEPVLLVGRFCDYRGAVPVVHACQFTRGRRSLHGGLSHAVLSRRDDRHEHGYPGDLRAPGPVHGRWRLDGHPRHAPVSGRENHQGADILPGRG